MSSQRLLLATMMILTLAACGGNRTLPEAADGGFDSAPGPGASTIGDGDANGIGVFEDDLGGGARAPVGLMDQLVIYFEFDSSDIRADFNSVLAAHGEYLASNPNAQVRLEGHADERGSREYNIGLGERRSQAVRRVLLLQGATADQLSTVSYGEERPAAAGSDEESYSLNRRVELVYR